MSELEYLIEKFFKTHQQGIKTLHGIFFKDQSCSLENLILELTEYFKNKLQGKSLDDLDYFLFYLANEYCKSKENISKLQYLCPACLYLEKESFCAADNIIHCKECEKQIVTATDPKMLVLLNYFVNHNKTGYHCKDCDRFISHPLNNSPIVSCPYFDCCFVGEWISLNKMHHPSKKVFKNDLQIIEGPVITKPIINKEIKILQEAIDQKINTISYSTTFTSKHKFLVCQAFSNLLKSQPTEMVNYLLHTSRSGGFQHKIFQEYVKLLEQSLPYYFKKNNKTYKVESLLDPNINIFDGISVFEGIILDKLEIKNNTKEFYIGGRKASYAEPYYIGKVLNIIKTSDFTSITDKMVEYSFSKIKMKDIDPGTQVIVTHLRIPPHYQMGGMVYVNRMRKDIVDHAKINEK